MNKPRCGFPDEKSGNSLRVKRYDARYEKWSKTFLKYYLSYGEDLSRNDQAKIFSKAFKSMEWRGTKAEIHKDNQS